MTDLPPLLPRRPRGPLEPARRFVGGLLAIVLVATLGAAGRLGPPPAPHTGIVGLNAVPAPPPGRSWGPRPQTRDNLATLAATNAGGLTLNTAGGPVHFLPGINLGST